MSSAGSAVSTRALGKRYRRSWALRECSITVPAGRISALVGPNGAGKSSLLHLLAGLRVPTNGTALIFGQVPRQTRSFLATVGFVAQEMPLYPRLSISGHREVFARLNSTWDDALFTSRITRLGLEPGQRCGSLSGGQQAQVALALALAKRPRLLLLDEPASALDPLARRELFASLREAAAQTSMTVVMSSHLIADLERVCDHLVLLSRAHTQLCGDISDLTAAHAQLTGPLAGLGWLERQHHVIACEQAAGHAKVLARLGTRPVDPAWTIEPAPIEQIVLAYMAAAAAPGEASREPAGER
jgi:ABC-2 type transport system ATP-binding protein